MVEFFNSIETQLMNDVIGGRGTSSWGDAQGGSYLELRIGTWQAHSKFLKLSDKGFSEPYSQ